MNGDGAATGHGRVPPLGPWRVGSRLLAQRLYGHKGGNVETFGAQGRFFTYEAMCSEPERVARNIRDLVPELDDLDLRQRLAVHHRRHSYHEMLTDMNARLDLGQVAAINRVLRGHRAVLEHFGYEIMDAGRASSRHG